MSDCGGQYESVCKGEFASIHTKLDRLDEAIRGNGRPGIQLRLLCGVPDYAEYMEIPL